MSSNRINQSVQKIIDGNDQPSQGNSIVSMAGAKGLNASDIINSNHVLSVDQLNVEGIDEINTDTGNKFKRDSVFKKAVAVYSLRPSYLPNGYPNPVVRLRRASDSDERDFNADELTGSVTGSELIANGDFATDSDWSKGAGWTISGGQASCNNTFGSNKKLGQAISEFTAGGYFKMEFTIVAFSSNTGSGLRACTTTERGWTNYGISTTGTYTAILNANLRQLSDFQFWCGDGETLTIDNVSVKPYTPTVAELWVLETIGASGTEPWGDRVTQNAFAATWYDQSGNGNDAGQSTANAQPKLITAGVTETENGKPTIVFDGNQDYLTLGTDKLGNTELFAGSSDRFSVYSVEKATTGTVFSKAVSSSGGRDIQLGYLSNKHYYNIRGDQTSIIESTGVQLLRVFNWDGSSAVANINGGVGSALNVGSAVKTTTDINIGSRSNGGFLLDGNIQEIIVYDSDQSANRTGIETDINNYYNIY